MHVCACLCVRHSTVPLGDFCRKKTRFDAKHEPTVLAVSYRRAAPTSKKAKTGTSGRYIVYVVSLLHTLFF